MNSLKKQIDIPSLLLVAVAVMMCCYILARGIFVSITVDEASSYLRYAQYSFTQISNYDVPTSDMIPNNHLLNSHLMRCSFLLFGVNDWALRLPNILIACVGIFYAVKLLRRMSQAPIEQLFFFALLYGNAYYVEFFSLARGYGLMHSFILISFYYSYSYLQKPNQLYLFGGLVAATLASYSNFIGLNYLLILSGMLGIVNVVNQTNKQSLYRSFGIILLNFLLCLALIYRSLLFVVNSRQSFGGTKGFWSDTVLSLLQNYTQQPLLYYFMLCLIIGIISIALFLFLKDIAQKDIKRLSTPYYFFSSILILMAVASISQAILFKTPYLLNRTALVYIPFWGIFTGLLWLKIKTDFHSIPFQQAVLPLFLAVLGFLFLQNANLKEVQEWQFDKYTKQALSDILLDKKREKSPQKAKIGVFNYTHTAFYFYIQNDTALTKAIALPTHHEFLVRDTLFDYYYITNEVPAAEMVANYTPLKEYGGGYGVWKKKQ